MNWRRGPAGSAVVHPGDWFDNIEGEFHYFLPSPVDPSWVPPSTLCVGEGNAYGGKWGAFFGQYLMGTDSFDEYDAAGSIGRGRIVNPKYQFTVKKNSYGFSPFATIEYIVDSVRFACDIEDLYDFNYEDSELASHAAACQIAFGNGRNGRTEGKIFYSRIGIDHSYAEPFILHGYSPLPVVPFGTGDNDGKESK